MKQTCIWATTHTEEESIQQRVTPWLPLGQRDRQRCPTVVHISHGKVGGKASVATQGPQMANGGKVGGRQADPAKQKQGAHAAVAGHRASRGTQQARSAAHATWQPTGRRSARRSRQSRTGSRPSSRSTSRSEEDIDIIDNTLRRKCQILYAVPFVFQLSIFCEARMNTPTHCKQGGLLL